MKYGVVTEFRDEYFFLSNFYMQPFEWRGIEFTSGEHAFSFAKGFCGLGTDPELQAHFDGVLNAPRPGVAKGLGRSLKIDVAQWDANKVQWMREIVHAKFLTGTGLAGKLINTGAMMLVEGNDWGDTFWGRCNGKGFNTLGVLLMEERGYWLKGDLK